MKSTDKRAAGPAALLVVAVFSCLAPTAIASETMDAADIAKTFSGMTLDGVYYNGQFFTETYDDDGSIRYHDASGADSGEWSVRDGKFCTFYEDQEGACFEVERDGANCFTFVEPDPDTGRIDPESWTSRGWSRAAKPTCPTAPEVAI
jgi:hypothetical protein